MNVNVFVRNMLLSAVFAAASGCASDPMRSSSENWKPATALAYDFIAFTTEFAIVTGRAITTAFGVGIEVGPPRDPNEKPMLPK